MQAQTFALTKIQPPVLRTRVVEREALESRLADAALDTPLTLLCAPAGFGKTVVLARLMARLKASDAAVVAWVSVDEDDDLQRLLACLCAALEPFDLPWRRAPEAFAGTACETRAQRRQLAGELVNTLAACDVARGVMVFEDMHRIEDPSVFEFLDLLLEQLPARWSVVVSSRVEPPLAMARLRARGELAEFRQDDLRFREADVEAMLHGASLPGEARQLIARTQGWPAGLRLSLSHADHRTAVGNGNGSAKATDASTSTTSGRAASTGQRHLFDYLCAEVLDQMPAALRLFLLRCSVLTELTAPRCAAVAEDPLAAQWLDEIERRGLFVSVLDSAELTLRLHDLFRDFLEDRLRIERSAELPGLLRRAADHEPDPVRKVGLLLRAGAWQPAEQALLDATPALLLAGFGAQVLRLVDAFPPGQRDASPVLALVRGLCAWPRFEWSVMHVAMQRAAAGFEQTGYLPTAQLARAFESVALTALGRVEEAAQRLAQVRAAPSLPRETEILCELMEYWQTGARGPAEGAALHLERMVDRLAEGATAQQWYRCLPHFLFVGRPGTRAPMERYARLAEDAAGESHGLLRAAVLVLRAWLTLWRGDVDAAHALIVEAQDADRWVGHPRNLRIPILSFLSAHHALRGNAAGLAESAQALLDDLENEPERRATWRGVHLYRGAGFGAALDDWGQVRRFAAELDRMPSAHEWPFMQSARSVVRALIALHEGRPEAACAELPAYLGSVDAVDTLGVAALLRVTLARAYLASNQAGPAGAVIAPVLAQALESGEPTPLLVTGPAALAELARGRWDKALPAAMQQQLKSLAALALALRTPAAPAAAAVGVPGGATSGHARGGHALTEREAEVLARMAAGDSNKLIARAFDLSPHTVKRHVANILDKLDLQSRGQAAAWWREQGHA